MSLPFSQPSRMRVQDRPPPRDDGRPCEFRGATALALTRTDCQRVVAQSHSLHRCTPACAVEERPRRLAAQLPGFEEHQSVPESPRSRGCAWLIFSRGRHAAPSRRRPDANCPTGRWTTAGPRRMDGCHALSTRRSRGESTPSRGRWTSTASWTRRLLAGEQTR